jgi:diacylglycerol kinase family enzyme
MRVAAILGLGSSTRDLQPFQHAACDWVIGLPSDPTGLDAILLFGGDGTVHRHLAALVRLALPVLVVPAGSGNDFARALGLFRVLDSLTAWHKFASDGSHVRAVDLGLITPLGAPSKSAAEASPNAGEDSGRPNNQQNDSAPGPVWEGPGFSGPVNVPPGGAALAAEDAQKADLKNSDALQAPSTYFSCAAGVGLDGEIARRANALPRWLRGHGGYALSLPGALWSFRPFGLRLCTSRGKDNPEFLPRSAQPVVVAVFANTPVYGGGMRVAPRAQMDDGLLDVCVIRDIPKLKLLGVFPTVYFGRHLGIREVEYFSAPRAHVETERPMEVYADGEYVCRTPFEVGVARGALRVIVP